MEEMTAGDCAWILSNAFLILTMQSGFGLLESGFVSSKNMANIMMKNVVDVCMGGITYWAFGYGLAFGQPSNWFCGFGDWFATAEDEATMGTFYTKYVFQFSFATAATTIVSGAVAERMKLSAYMLFSVLNVFVYVFPSSWAWNNTGFLNELGFHDFAGSCVVHLTGGTSALVMAKMLGPRMGRFDPGGRQRYGMSSPVTALTGTFMLWWAWLAFNCGSTFAIEGIYWKLAAKVATNTLNGSIGGGISAITFSLVSSRGKTYDIAIIITGVLGGLVGVTAGCGTMSPLLSLLVGAGGSLVALGVIPLMEWLHIDDPVGAISVHVGSASFGTLAVGLFGHNQFNLLQGRQGLVYGGYEQLAVQVFGMTVIIVWSTLTTLLICFVITVTTGMRMTEEEELLGADLCEHNVNQSQFAVKLEENISDLDNVLQQVIMQVLETTTNRTEHGNRVTMPAAYESAEHRQAASSYRSNDSTTLQHFVNGTTQPRHEGDSDSMDSHLQTPETLNAAALQRQVRPKLLSDDTAVA